MSENIQGPPKLHTYLQNCRETSETTKEISETTHRLPKFHKDLQKYEPSTITLLRNYRDICSYTEKYESAQKHPKLHRDLRIYAETSRTTQTPSKL
jgi:hypothetical protein